MENQHIKTAPPCRASETIVWRGIGIEIIHTANYCAGMDHSEIHSENKIAVPITETGYKSHFFPSGGLNGYANAVEYVRAWLDHEAKTKAWKAQEFASRQGAFDF
ncbi:MAG: hypothetical protein GQ535_17080 [Rhodobacteraceae bacterium]|nr:hypothetical protein [Paracoccaceae bacterium]